MRRLDGSSKRRSAFLRFHLIRYKAQTWLGDLMPSLSGESVWPNRGTVDPDTPEAFANAVVLHELINRSLKRENLFDGIPELIVTARADFPEFQKWQDNGHLLV